MAGLKHPVTPDGRYFVLRGRLWRLANPNLSAAKRSALVSELMVTRSGVRSARLAAEATAHYAVDVAKRKLGERGSVWWTDGSPDLNRHMVKNTPHASWCSGLRTAGRREQRAQSLGMEPAKRRSGCSDQCAENGRSTIIPGHWVTIIVAHRDRRGAEPRLPCPG
jgi:hypothetical protein